MIRKVKGQLVSFINTRKGKVAAAGAALLASGANAHAQATVETLTTQVEGITGDAQTAYIAAAGLGVAALIVSVIVYMSRKGWKLR